MSCEEAEEHRSSCACHLSQRSIRLRISCPSTQRRGEMPRPKKHRKSLPSSMEPPRVSSVEGGSLSEQHGPEFSRICVKNIPVHLNERRLKKIFEVKGQVTDAKILLSKTGRSRKMAFVGYKTPAEAQEALEYFHNTYIDTSKITVEPAYAKGHSHLPRPWSRYSMVSGGENEIRLSSLALSHPPMQKTSG